MKISQENNKPIMPSAPGFAQFKANITNTDQSDSNTTCHNVHIIPAEEYLVNNTPTLDNQETTPENSTEMTVETQRPSKHSKQDFTPQRPLKHSKQASLKTYQIRTQVLPTARQRIVQKTCQKAQQTHQKMA
jgi:hypothetical protein